MRQAAKLFSRSQFTIAHGGRQIRFGPVAFWIAVGSLVIMAAWSATTATYFAFRDDVLKNLMARQAAQQYAYEDRIAELRTQIDRTTSRQLLDREQFDRKLDDLLHREATLESRASALGSIADPMATGSLRPAMRDSDLFAAPQRLNRGTMLEPGRESAASGKTANIGETLDRVQDSLDRVDRRQSATLAQMQERYDSEARKVHSVLASLGLKLDAPSSASGGPFVPIKLPPESQSFERAIMRVSIARAEADRLDSALATVPLHIPVSGEVEISSPFGVRIDPFQHVAAMHTGIDFRGEFGEPIHATANGTVTNAGWSGGYGNMVEIDHGNGLATRYGHLSAIDVQIGQRIRTGQVIGRLGSTGRSTGPHLHYETRINGEAVDPDKFLIAGAKLFGLPQEVRRSARGEVQD
jgi:murein DD-endopeptidase MepM/ murein hydrolase activator NlpD